MNIPKLDLHPDSAEWSEQINSYEHSMHLLKEIFECRITGDEDTLTMLSHPDSKNKHGLSVFKDTGKMHFRTGNFDGVEKEDTLTTWDFISVAMERNPIKCAHEFKWIDAANYLDEEKTTKAINVDVEVISAQRRVEIGRSLPPSRKLVGDMILEKEQTIVFAPTNTGKTVFTISMAVAIAEGVDLNLGSDVILENECEPKTVIYFDFELSDTQFIKRVGDRKLPDNLYFVRKERGLELPTKPKDIFEFLKAQAEKVNANVIIVDNLAAISHDLEEGEKAKEFMQAMFNLVRFEDYTTILVGHTAKRKRDSPIFPQDLAGSAMVSNLMDAMVGLNHVNSDSGFIYIKHVKSRNDDMTYGAGSVICSRIEADQQGFVHHACYGVATESEALGGNMENEAYKRDALTFIQYKILGSMEKVAEEMKIVKSAVHKRIRNFEKRFPDKYEEYSNMELSDLQRNLSFFLL